MTLEQLTGLSGDQWEALSQAELDKWAERFHNVTRPTKEKIEATKATATKHSAKASLDNLQQMAMKLANKYGIELDK